MTRDRIWRWVPWIGFLLALGLHLWRFDVPAAIVSDEVSFVRDGQAYILHQPYFDPHPPLGKMQLGAAFSIFGYGPWTWRIFNAVEGALLIPVLWWLAYRLTKRRRLAALTAGLALLDGLLLTDSRLGLINIPYLLTSLSGLGCVLMALERPRPRRWLLAAGVLFGLAISVKWLALMVVLPAAAVWLWPKALLHGGPERTRQQTIESLAVLLALPAVMYWLIFALHFAWLGVPATFFTTNANMLNYHLQVPPIGDPYAQPWWGWLLAWQPFLYWQTANDGLSSFIWSMPNPWLWWTGAGLFLTNLVVGWRTAETRFLNILLLMAWLPFALISRVMYSYHMLLYSLLLSLLIAWWLDRWWSRIRSWAIAYVVVALAVFIWFAPWYLNLPLDQRQHQLRRWLPEWQVAPPVTQR